MNDEQFDQLKAAIMLMARHVRGEKVPGLRVYEVHEPDVRTIRDVTAKRSAESERINGLVER
jgi:hypothetical protein